MRPIKCRRQHSIGYHFILNNIIFNFQLVRLLSVAASMRKLEVVDVAWMSSLADRNDVVDRW